MDAFAVPGDVLTVLAAAGLRPAGSLGATAWLAAPVEGDAGALLELHVVPVAFDDRVVARASALVALDDEHLPRVRSVVPLGPGRSGLLVEHVVGTPLGRLLAARAPLSDGEAVTVAVPVAGALAALHRQGLVHGTVRADAVVVDAGGRPVLTDLRGALLAHGSAHDDLRRLVATVLDAMPGADRARGAVPGAAAVRDELEVLIASPALSADAIVDRCFAAAPPEPLRLPDAGALVWAEVVGEPDRARSAMDREPEGVRPSPPDDGSAAQSRRARRVAERAEADARRPTVRVRGSTWTVVAAAVLVCAACAGVLAARHAAAVADSGPDGAGRARESDAVATAGSDVGDIASVAVALTAARAAALAAVDEHALAAVDAPGSPALAADRALVQRLGADHLEGVRVHAAATPSAAAVASAASVLVTSTTSAYVRVGADGSRTAVPAGAERTVALDLRRTADGWRVWDVRPGS